MTGGHTYAVTYDGAGHPLNYLGAAMTWDNAGNLASIQKGSNPFLPSATSSVSYTYLANGQRRSKTVGSNTTTYRYNNGLLLSQTTGTGSTAETLSFTYDADGKPVSITYKQGSNAAVTYFYAYNGQGDVIAIYNSSNSTLVGSYEYDLWGKLISATPASSSSDPKGILTKNPFRYRGYYYDTETGYYYLNARYYDPQVRRFISADDMAYLGADGTVNTYNLFAYCENDPVQGYDPTGCYNKEGVITGVIITAIGIGIAVGFCESGVGIAVGAAITAAGGIVTYESATDGLLVVDVSDTIPLAKLGVSTVIDFKKGEVNAYPHVGLGIGYTAGACVAVGKVENYEKAEDYAGPFVDMGAGYYAGIDFCQNPIQDFEVATRATSVTLSNSPGAYFGFDWYLDPHCLMKWSE